MKTYDVTIECTIRQTLRVEAENEEDAEAAAHEQFGAGNATKDEYYNEDCLKCVEVFDS